ncbi:MAG: NADH-quinone oxidoreductase subunit NuoH [Gemmatimonadetes bacterium]|nr:NADH-quinone oxidoreductase subunit NuoH [Gemmatimonadota bacterium]MBI2536722.1 NADH-quinone oxidoreductase subunit NuoH [Gemmatimonadota bacterium]
MIAIMLATWLERRGSAFMQDRLGPNRVGPAGLLQPVADGLKNFLKEETWPKWVDQPLFLLAPLMSFIPSLITFAVIPFAAPLPGFDFTLPLLGRFTYQGPIPMVVADLPIGLLFILAISSLAVYGIVLAGWSSASKYSMLGGIRSSAQMISYEIALGLSVITVFILSGNVTLSEVVAAQQRTVWFVLALTVAFVLFLVSAFAETNRLPFDLPEAEAELVTGYHTEYSAMKFSMFYVAEYAAILTMSALIATLFFGGWDIPFTRWDEGPPSVARCAATLLAFGTKTGFFLLFYIWVRWTLPRFRFDQLMELGWKVMLPVALGYITVIGLVVWGAERVGVALAPVLIGLNLVATAGLLWGLDRGRLLAGARARRAA